MLGRHSFLLLINLIAILLLPVNCADKYTDENRPYEFGFNIEGEQHRHEKKDENGLIMGEFGFITADGVYHVTVYATDENGNFKILSMKNIRVKPYPTAKTSERTGHSLKVPAAPEPAPTPEATTLAPTTTTAASTFRTPKRISLQPPRACSSCSIPTTSTAPPPANVEEQIQNNANAIAQSPQRNQPAPISPNILPPVDNNNQQLPPVNYPQSPAVNTQLGSRSNFPSQNSPNNVAAYDQQPGINPQQQNPAINPEQPENIQNPPKQGQRESKQYNINDNNIDNGIDNRAPAKPVLISAQMQIVDKNTDITHKNPGETDGLPKGLNSDDMTTLLYTFNYTVGFHGHYEEGYRNGAKKGYYFITGRNGVRNRVDYEADDKGFRPRISQEVLDILSDEVPKPETEKDEKFGLKGYEFKWLYYPASSR